MGGLGSGRYYRRKKRLYLDDCLDLDLAYMNQFGAIPSCGKNIGTLQWLDEKTGRDTASIRYTVDTRNSEKPFLLLHYCLNGKRNVDYEIQLSFTNPNYGGRRFWFICPVSGKRVTKLYLYDGFFVSRHVCRLAYESQSENAIRRLSRKRWKAVKKADNSRGFPSRPKGMHRNTYARMIRDFLRLEDEIEKRILQRYGDII